MNSVSSISFLDIPEMSMSMHPRRNHRLQYSVSQPIAVSFSLPLNTVRHFAQNDVDPSNVSAILSILLSNESLYMIASESLPSESEDDVSLNFLGALLSHFCLSAASVAIAVAFAFWILLFSYSSHFFFASS